MLQQLDLEKIFRAAKRRGFTRVEIYAECSVRSKVTHRDKLQSVHLETVGGISLRALDNGTMKILSSPSPSTEALLELLGEEGDAKKAGPSKAVSLNQSAHPEKFSVLQHLVRELESQSRLSLEPHLAYDDEVKNFEVINDRGIHAQGIEESASLSASGIFLDKENERRPYSLEIHRSSIPRFLSEIQNDVRLSELLKNELAPFIPQSSLWPAPRGEFPVLWSNKAFAKLSLHFLRAFEGDLFLGNHSFLTDIPVPLPMPFRIEDIPYEKNPGFDHEGSPRKKMTLFQDGRPRGLACNLGIAEQLSVPSTGHCRRESYQCFPTVGFWNPVIHGTEITEDPIKHLDAGILVHDVEIVRFQPKSAEITIRLRSASLVHHGEEGEAVEPVVLTLPLIKLLQACRYFSPIPRPFGFSIAKQGQQFLTEVQTPSVLSDPLPIPGSVPANHYW